MRPLLVRAVASLGLLAWLAATPARAQPIYRGPAGAAARPAYNPYLNLLRGGNPGINYYGLVRPELEFRQDYQGLQNQLTQGFSSVNQAIDQASGLPVTGHGVLFLNTGHYFAGSAGLRGGIGRPGGLGGSTFGGLNAVRPQTPVQAPAARRY